MNFKFFMLLTAFPLISNATDISNNYYALKGECGVSINNYNIENLIKTSYIKYPSSGEYKIIKHEIQVRKDNNGPKNYFIKPNNEGTMAWVYIELGLEEDKVLENIVQFGPTYYHKCDKNKANEFSISVKNNL